MKSGIAKVVGLVLLVLITWAVAQNPQKLWVSIQYREHADRVIFIEDRETHTRCYAITNNEVNMAGYAISCVPAGAR